MTFDQTALASAASAILFAATFLFGHSVHPLQSIVRDRRTIVSFGAGVSTAYLFVRMMPELAEAQEILGQEGSKVTNSGMIAYLFALIGFLLVYGLDHFRRNRAVGINEKSAGTRSNSQAISSRNLGMMLYVFLLTYVLVQDTDASASATLQYAIAISFHFLAMDHSLRDEFGDEYDKRVRFVFAAMCLLGWLAAQLIDLPAPATALLLAFVSGGVIVNSAIMELPTDRDGRFLPFALGSLLFGLVLMAV